MANRTNKKIALLLCMTVGVIVFTFSLQRVPQPLSYHRFADSRALWGMPNFANVISNLPFLFAGFLGLRNLRKADVFYGIKIIYFFLFIGIVLTGIGSAYYHYAPDNNTLVDDRIPMTIVFMALLSATIAEFISVKWGLLLLFPLLVTGVGSVAWWHYTEMQGLGDLRPYGLVQFYPLVAIPVIMFLFPTTQYRRASFQLIWVVVWYIIAKVFELGDNPIYTHLHFISGHSLKHLAAAISAWYLVRLYRAKHGLISRGLYRMNV